MPRISLRAYEKQIEDLIEGNHLQEAITHCRYILTTFPKCISTYRILGKSFLEGKQYSESADVFKRVLAVFPDDFIAHAGMSIVRENENDLDAAIWHMELAFDSQPSNIAIQEELKRLFGRRDGTHPAKIRLTRGALVRMYAKGELYPQAIAEIKSALAEDAKRIDLSVLLAKMYFLLGDASEALALCNQLILELPYCYELNKILVTITPSGVKSENQSIHLDRLKALDPYEDFVGNNFPTAADVPDDQVLIEQLTDVEPDETNLDSNWVKTMENGWEESPGQNAMKWLPETPGEKNTEKSADFTIPQTNAEAPMIQSQDQPVSSHAETISSEEETQLPDWMRSAGWLPTNDPSTPADTSPDDSNPEIKEPEELPDWLRSLSTSKAESTAQDPFAIKTGEDISPESSANSGVSDESRDKVMPPKKEEANTGNDLPDWLKNYEIESPAEPDSTDDLPDWMKSINEVQPVNGTAEKPPFTEIDPLDNPFLSAAEETEKVAPVNTPSSPADWKAVLIEESNSQEKVPQENPDIPEWVRSVLQQKQSSQPIEAQSNLSADAEEKPPLEPEKPAESQQEEPANSVLSEKSGDDLLSWLRDLKPTDDLPAESTEEPENSESENSSEFSTFDDGSPLDRLQQVTDLVPGQNTEIDSAIEENSNPIPDSFAEPENNSIPPASQPVDIGEPTFEEQLPVKPEENSNALKSKETDIELEQPISPSHSNNTEKTVQDVITELVAVTKSNPDDFLAWQRLGDAYAKENKFAEALHAYNQAEELILNNK